MFIVPPVAALPSRAVGCAAQAGRRERSGSRPCRDGCRPRHQRDGHSAPPPAARLDPIELISTAQPLCIVISMDASAWVALIAAIIALLSGVYTRVAAQAAVKQAAEARHQTDIQRKLYEDSIQPYVWVDIAPDTAQGSIIKLIVCNQGPTVAANVRLQFDPPLPEVFDYQKIDRVQDSMDAGIKHLAPSRRVQWVLGTGPALFAKKSLPPIAISVSCDGPNGPCPLNKYVLDLSYIRYSHDNPDGSLHQVAERIKELAKTVESTGKKSH